MIWSSEVLAMGVGSTIKIFNKILKFWLLECILVEIAVEHVAENQKFISAKL